MTASRLNNRLLQGISEEGLAIVFPIYTPYDFKRTVNSLLTCFDRIRFKVGNFKLFLVNCKMDVESEGNLERFVTELKREGLPIKYLKVPGSIKKTDVLDFIKPHIETFKASNILFIERDIWISALNTLFENALIKESILSGCCCQVEGKTPDYVVFKTKNFADVQKQLKYLRQGNYPISKTDPKIKVYVDSEFIGTADSIEISTVPIEDRPKVEIEIPIKTPWKKPKVEKPVGLVMSTWGRKDLVEKCIVSLNENTEYPFKLIVIDDGSGKKLVDMLKSFKKKKYIEKLITFPEHVGRRGKPALNNGLKYLQEKLWDVIGYVGNLDSDFEIIQPLWLRACVEGLELCQEASKKYKIGAISVNGENNLHKDIYQTINVNDFSIDVKHVLGGGQYIYKRDHFDNVPKGMVYYTGIKTCNDWKLWEKHLKAGYHCGHITKAYSIYTFNFIPHVGAGKRSWDKTKEMP